jgi:MoxR-like ATPase
LKVNIDYPTEEEELQIMNLNEKGSDEKINKILSPTEISKLQNLVEKIYVDDKIKEYIKNIVFRTRAKYDNIAFGASPRASIALLQTSKVIAFLSGRGYVIPEDIKEIALDVLRHRVIPTYEAEAENITSEEIVIGILDEVQVP